VRATLLPHSLAHNVALSPPCAPGVVTTVRFKMPSAGAALFPSPGPKRTVPTYYSFNYGPVHFMNYDTEIPYDVGTPQWRCAPAGPPSRARLW
jgi:hypothetical protein